MAEGGHSLRYFSGEEADHREYKRWKLWVQNKMRVTEKLAEEARGSFVWTLLQGKALEVVEHLALAEYQKKDGDRVLFELLDQRWPEKDRADELGEHVSEVFLLKSKEGENIRQWCARAREVFDRCNRKTGVQFPEEARGWLVLNCSGMSEEQRAVVLARCHGSLKFDDVSQAMRSCYPEYVVPKRRSHGAHYAEYDDESTWWDEAYGPDLEPRASEGGFDDVEMFLAEHNTAIEPLEEETYQENEVAEVLAATWKEKRQELSKLQRARRFTQARDVRRSFRVEVEELKKKTKCHRCGKTGHWARECTQPRTTAGAPASAGAASSSGAGLVEFKGDFVCYVLTPTRATSPRPSMLDQLRERRSSASDEVLLVSSPGYAVLDSGCGRSIVGESTLEIFRRMWRQAGIAQPSPLPEVNSFRFGNGHQETSQVVVEMPVVIAGQPGIVRAAVIKGQAPLLMSRAALKKIKATMNFEGDELTLFDSRQPIKMEVNEAGQYMIPVADFESIKEKDFSKLAPADEECLSAESGVANAEDAWELQGSRLIRHHRRARDRKFRPDEAHDCPVPVTQLASRRETCNHDGRVIDSWRKGDTRSEASSAKWVGQTIFEVMPPPACHESGLAMCQWTKRQWRQVRSQVKGSVQVSQTTAAKPKEGPAVVELFGSPSFGKLAATRGIRCLSADLATGWDFREFRHREAMKHIVQECRPELLCIAAPCSSSGGWQYLNKPKLVLEEIQEKSRLVKLFANFAADLAQIQLAAGGRIVFESPALSPVWSLPKIEALRRSMHEFNVDLCQYHTGSSEGGFRQRPTKLLVSHENMRSLQRKCPGDHSHQTFKSGLLKSPVDGFPLSLARAVLRTVPSLRDTAACLVQAGTDHECLAAARVRELNEQKRGQMLESLKRLHNNLGHPSVSSLQRVLKHGGANQAAIELAKELECDVCKAQGSPSSPPPAQTHRATRFNQRIGIDVKYLPGWKPNQRIPSLNIVDYASSFQIMVPLHVRETAELIRKALLERWVSWAGVPQEIVLDPAQTNLSEALTTPQELAGSTIATTAAEAHWQLGKVEVHGGWFARVLQKVIADTMPHDQKTWEECVHAAHSKNELIQVYGMTPAQFVFGRNPHLPTNLLDEPLDIVPATASLHEEAIQRSIAVRQAARTAVIELQDSKALRLAWAARPRRIEAFRPGAFVAYWRTQKSHEGVIERGGRWYGPAVVLGHVGKNVVVVHKKQIFRCAPEQVRAATSEEASLATTPQLELLGIKNLVESGGLQSRQYVDLVPLGFPPVQSQSEDAVMSDANSPEPPPNPLNPAPPNIQTFRQEHTAQVNAEPVLADAPAPSLEEATGDYGPVRHRVSHKSSPTQLVRPRAMLQDDFADMMRDVVPRLVASAVQSGASSSSEPNSVPAPSQEERGRKREASTEPAGPSSENKRQAVGEDEPLSEPADANQLEDEALLVQEILAVESQNPAASFESLVLAHVNKRATKEIPAFGNPLELQNQVDEAKLLEWNTVSGRPAARIVLGAEADEVRRHHPDRIMGSRYVVTWKQEEDGPKRVKARWCLQGHLDPDLSSKALAGDLQSPALSQLGRALAFQLIASFRWCLMLGDVKGAFLSSGELPKHYRPLYARLPAGGIPGVPSSALIEVVGQVYGLNDAPSAWYKTFDKALREVGFERSHLDKCLYFMREGSQLSGVFGIHVDDSVTGGTGARYEKALEQLKQRFEFRKWRVRDGDFCGARYVQDPSTGEITMSQAAFVDKIRPLHMNRRRIATER